MTSLRFPDVNVWLAVAAPVQVTLLRFLQEKCFQRAGGRQEIPSDTLSALPPQTLKEAREIVEREMIQGALRRHRGKITSAALELGISRPTLY